MGPVTHVPQHESAAQQERRIEGQGTPEAAWQAWLPLRGCPVLRADHLAPRSRRLVVVAPHPDDEVLACGGLLSARARQHARAASMDSVRGRDVLVVSVTDGEASHPGSRRWTADRLAARRRQERATGLRRLGLEPSVTAIGLPDGGVAEHEEVLVACLRNLLHPDDVVVTTWRFDGHPDHESTGRACARVASERESTLVEVPVWTWHWAAPGDARVPWHRMARIPLDAQAMACKRMALAAHETQLQPDEHVPPVLFTGAVERLMRQFEYVFVPETAP